MRVLAIEAFEGLLGAGGEGADWAVKRAVLLSAVLFALLHVGAPDAAASATVILQMLVKFGQAFLFGLVMGVLYARARSLWPCAVAHAGFDALYLGPGVVLTACCQQRMPLACRSIPHCFAPPRRCWRLLPLRPGNRGQRASYSADLEKIPVREIFFKFRLAYPG